MGTICKSTCPNCGVVEVMAELVRLMVCMADSAQSYYSFPCPECGDDVYHPADAKLIIALNRADVPSRRWTPVAWSARQGGPPITIDDLIDFHANDLDYEAQRLCEPS
jgi:predicted RNA-binding Zn-ribbon protein involved in translation (DUF1610 family)